MKLRNKKTGEIVNFGSPAFIIDNTKNSTSMRIKNLAKLNEEWEDYEEPKEYWFIAGRGVVEHELDTDDKNDPFVKGHKEMGNYFKTKEEAEKAVEKLKAWKRLKDAGFKIIGWTIDDGLRVSICTNLNSDGLYDEDRKETKKNLDTCFGGEE